MTSASVSAGGGACVGTEIARSLVCFRAMKYFLIMATAFKAEIVMMSQIFKWNFQVD